MVVKSGKKDQKKSSVIFKYFYDMSLKKACACVRNLLNDDASIELYCKEESRRNRSMMPVYGLQV